MSPSVALSVVHTPSKTRPTYDSTTPPSKETVAHGLSFARASSHSLPTSSVRSFFPLLPFFASPSASKLCPPASPRNLGMKRSLISMLVSPRTLLLSAQKGVKERERKGKRSSPSLLPSFSSPSSLPPRSLPSLGSLPSPRPRVLGLHPCLQQWSPRRVRRRHPSSSGRPHFAHVPPLAHPSLVLRHLIYQTPPFHHTYQLIPDSGLGCGSRDWKGDGERAGPPA